MSLGNGGRHDLLGLASHLGNLRFALIGDRERTLRRDAERVAALLRGVSKRAETPEAPLLLVVAGGTGAGKSTTVNTLADKPVVAASVIRPTTRAPTLVCHPRDEHWFSDDRVLPQLSRVTNGADDATTAGARLVLATSTAIPEGIGLLDTPDIDSVEGTNHWLAQDAMDAADAWVWLATSRTYADEVGVEYLHRAHARHALLAVVITQVRPHEADEVLDDADRLLADQECPPDVRLAIPYVSGTDDQLPPHAVDDLREWIAQLTGDVQRRDVRRRALDGALAAVPRELEPLAAAVDEELMTATRLRQLVTDAYDPVLDQLDAELGEGVSLRADVLSQWRTSLGSDPFARFQSVTNRVRDLVSDAIRSRRGDDGGARRVQVEVQGSVTEMVTRLLEQASWHARRGWEQDPIGRRLLDNNPRLRQPNSDRDRRVEQAISGWRDHTAALIEEVAPEKRTRARVATTGINAVATSAILVLFASSGGLTGGEAGIAAVWATGSQALLVKILGEHNVRRLLSDIKTDLRDRVIELLEIDQIPYHEVVQAAEPDEEVVGLLREVTADRRLPHGR